MDLIEYIDLFDLIPTIILGVAEEARTMRTPRNTGQPGGVYLQELLGSSEKRIYSVLRMKRETTGYRPEDLSGLVHRSQSQE